MFFLVVFRIALFVVLLLALLKVKKRRFRHWPVHRTRISRRNGETTLWLERLVNALVDMWYASLVPVASQNPAASSATSRDSDHHSGGVAGADADDGSGGNWDSELADPAVPGEFGAPPRQSVAAAATALLQPMLTHLEERVNASLEDSGVAAWADFRVHSVGARPPRLRAIHIIQQHAGPVNSPNTPPPMGTTAPKTNAGQAGGASGIVHSPSGTGDTFASSPSFGSGVGNSNSGGGGAAGSGAAAGGGNSTHGNPLGSSMMSPTSRVFERSASGGSASFGSASMRLRRTAAAGAGGGVVAEDESVSGGVVGGHADGHDVDRTAGGSSPPTTGTAPGPSALPTGASTPASSSPTVLEFEAEVEYSGRLDVSLKADVSFARGRLVPVYVRLQDVRLLRVHARVKVQLCVEPATMESPRKPYLQCTLWLESDPQFDMTLRTSLTRLNIQDFFLVPTLARFFLLRFVRSKLVRRNKAPGISFRVPVPADLMDGGETSWTAESVMTDYFKDLNSTWRPQ